MATLSLAPPWLTVIDQLDGARATSLVDDLERRAIAAYLGGAEEASEELWALAHTESLKGNDPQRAARCIFWLALDLFNRGEWARGHGWIARGYHLLEEAQDSPELGLLSVLESRHQLKEGDVGAATKASNLALHLAGRTDDSELAIFSRLSVGLVHARGGQYREAAALFDEVMVAVTVDDVSPIAVGVVYCAVIGACHSLFDVGRAREWTTALSRWCSAQPDMVAFRGRCLVHRSEIMRFSGEWPEALAEAEQACAWSKDHASSFKYPSGAAFYELAEVHRLRGNLQAAEAAYRQASEHGQPPEPGLTLLRFAQGKTEMAEAAVHRLLNEQQAGVVRIAVLRAAVDILTATGDARVARNAAEELGQIPTSYYAPALRAAAAHAMGAVCLSEGDAQAAIADLREAWTLWQELEIPYDAARARVLLGLACQQLGDRATAELELDTARRVFERLSAEPDVTRVDELRQRPDKTAAHTLTARELQVIELVARGKTNRAIAKLLTISERTVDRHVSNILLKLDLPSRSAATAYAWQHDLIPPTG